MSKVHCGFALTDLYKNSDKTIEIRKERTRVPFTIISFESRATLKSQMYKEAEQAAIKTKARTEARISAAIAWISGQNAPKDERSCECGAHTLSSHAHSTWCPIFNLSFTRGKNSKSFS